MASSASLPGRRQSTGPLKSPQKASYRSLSDVLHLGARLEDAKTCCGVLYCTFGNGDNCWEATNEVQRIYNTSLSNRIDEILKDTQDFWAQSARCRYIFCHSIYMVGREKEKSKPVIFFCCENAALRIKARDVVKENLNMKEYPAFRFGHASVPPGPTAHLRFAGQGASSEVQIDGELSRKVYLKRPVQALCGVQVLIEGDGREIWIDATVGGVVSLNGKCFGLTVAHGLFDYGMLSEEMGDGDWSLEYDSVDEDSIPGTSQTISTDQKEQKTSSIMRTHIVIGPEADSSGSMENRISKEKGVQEHPTLLLGIIKATSIENSSLGLDWALIDIDYDQIDSVNEFWIREATGQTRTLRSSPNRQDKCIHINALSQSLSPRCSVLALTGRGAPIPGTISGTLVSMRLPGSTEMCEVWNVQLDGPIEQGDCGSFVVHAITGNLYGSIVASNLGTGFVYILPAYKTQLDIARRFDCVFSLPTNEEYRQSRAIDLAAALHNLGLSAFLDEIDLDADQPSRSSPPLRPNPAVSNLFNPRLYRPQYVSSPASTAYSHDTIHWGSRDPSPAIPVSWTQRKIDLLSILPACGSAESANYEHAMDSRMASQLRAQRLVDYQERPEYFTSLTLRGLSVAVAQAAMAQRLSDFDLAFNMDEHTRSAAQ